MLDGLPDSFERDPVHALPCFLRRPMQFGVDRSGQAELERPVRILLPVLAHFLVGQGLGYRAPIFFHSVSVRPESYRGPK